MECVAATADNGIGDTGCAALASALCDNSSVTTLDIVSESPPPPTCVCDGALIIPASHGTMSLCCGVDDASTAVNSIGDAGCGVIALALRKNTSLTTLHARSE